MAARCRSTPSPSRLLLRSASHSRAPPLARCPRPRPATLAGLASSVLHQRRSGSPSSGSSSHRGCSSSRSSSSSSPARTPPAKRRLTEVILVSSDDEAAPRPTVKMTTRGPKKTGNAAFDKHCVYANKVALKPSQVEKLKRRVRDPTPTIPYYVCTIQEAHVIPKKAKMYFNKPYTTQHIKKHLALEEEHSLEVYYKAKNIAQVRKIFSKTKNKGASITTNWKDVVNKTKMRRGDIFVFWFRRHFGGLKIVVTKLV
ncbi:hypothetical protein ZWY2020_016091 [Hordeum vulgare]|nr:hypothetical protein ZWY2020_016091 [Hordeum vulgare]